MGNRNKEQERPGVHAYHTGKIVDRFALSAKTGRTRLVDNIFTNHKGFYMKFYAPVAMSSSAFELDGNFVYTPGGPLWSGDRIQISSQSGVVFTNNVLHRVEYRALAQGGIPEGNLFVRAEASYNAPSRESNLFWKESDLSAEQPRVILRPNKSDPGRAHLAIINWSGAPHARVPFSSFLAKGDRFELRVPSDYYGPPALLGTYDGVAVDVPLTGEMHAYAVIKTPESATPAGSESVSAGE